jgi:hypothetical protein
MKGFDAVDAEGVEVLSVVGICESAAEARPEPVILFA